MRLTGHHARGLSESPVYVVRATVGIGHRVGVRTSRLAGTSPCQYKARSHPWHSPLPLSCRRNTGSCHGALATTRWAE